MLHFLSSASLTILSRRGWIIHVPLANNNVSKHFKMNLSELRACKGVKNGSFFRMHCSKPLNNSILRGRFSSTALGRTEFACPHTHTLSIQAFNQSSLPIAHLFGAQSHPHEAGRNVSFARLANQAFFVFYVFILDANKYAFRSCFGGVCHRRCPHFAQLAHKFVFQFFNCRRLKLFVLLYILWFFDFLKCLLFDSSLVSPVSMFLFLRCFFVDVSFFKKLPVCFWECVR